MATFTAEKRPVKTAPKTASKPALAAKKAATYAVFTTGGKQYRVKVGDKVKIEKIDLLSNRDLRRSYCYLRLLSNCRILDTNRNLLLGSRITNSPIHYSADQLRVMLRKKLPTPPTPIISGDCRNSA